MAVSIQKTDEEVVMIGQLNVQSNVFVARGGWGWLKFIKIDDLFNSDKKYLSADTLTLVIDVSSFQIFFYFLFAHALHFPSFLSSNFVKTLPSTVMQRIHLPSLIHSSSTQKTSATSPSCVQMIIKFLLTVTLLPPNRSFLKRCS
jgi:hypothetical protein